MNYPQPPVHTVIKPWEKSNHCRIQARRIQPTEPTPQKGSPPDIPSLLRTQRRMNDPSIIARACLFVDRMIRQKPSGDAVPTTSGRKWIIQSYHIVSKSCQTQSHIKIISYHIISYPNTTTLEKSTKSLSRGCFCFLSPS